MAKITLPPINAGISSQAKINENFASIEDALNNKVLYRNNPIGEPNALESSLDFNSNSLVNIGTVSADNFKVGGEDITAGIQASQAAAADSAAEAYSTYLLTVNAKDASELALDTFTDIYLGKKSVAPTLDNDGNAIQEGAIYWNTVGKGFWFWDSTQWILFDVVTAGNAATTATTKAAEAVDSAELADDLRGYAKEWADKATDVSIAAGGGSGYKSSKTRATESAASAAAALTSQNIADDFAVKPENTLGVYSADYSAKHYSLKSKEWADKAENSAVSALAGGGAGFYSAKHHSAKAALEKGYANEWAVKATDVSVAAGGGTGIKSAKTHAEASSTSAAASLTSQNLAADYANKPEDVLGANSGTYSALHYAAKSEIAKDASVDAQGLAETAQGLSETAQAASELALTQFQAMWLGDQSSDPTLNSVGVALSASDEGVIFWHTGSKLFRIWDGAAWQNAPTVNPVTVVEADASTYRMITASDLNKTLHFDSAEPVKILLPKSATSSIAAGFKVEIVQRGTGAVWLAVEGEDTLAALNGNQLITGQYGTVTVTKLIDSTASTWGVGGDLVTMTNLIQANFVAADTNNILPQTHPDFVRATDGTVSDMDGNLYTVPANELRHEGAHRAENLAPESKMTDSGGVPVGRSNLGGAATPSAIVSGDSQSWRIESTAAALRPFWIQYFYDLVEPHSTWLFSIVIDDFGNCADASIGQILSYQSLPSGATITFQGGISGSTPLKDAGIVEGERLYWVMQFGETLPTSLLTTRFGLGTSSNTVAGTRITISRPQLENITGQSIQLPSPYIPTTTVPITKWFDTAPDGTPLRPFTMVDGEKLYDTYPKYAVNEAVTSGDRKEITINGKDYYAECSATGLTSATEPDWYNEVQPELVTNGTFDSDTGWTKGFGWTISGGKAIHAGAGGDIYIAITCEVGVSYSYQATVDATGDSSIANTAVQIRDAANTLSIVQVLSAGITPSGITNLSQVFVATETTHIVRVYSADNITIDNISVRPIFVATTITDNTATWDIAPTNYYTYRGPLIEEARTNLLSYSSEFDNAAWIKQNTTVTATALKSPIAGQVVYSAVPTGVGINSVYRVMPFTNSGVISVIAKANGYSKFKIGTSTFYAIFDLGLGTIYSEVGTTTEIQNLGDGWYRCVVVRVASFSTNIGFEQYTDAYTRVSTDADGVSGMLFAHAQLESNVLAASSPIITTTAAVTRNADALSYDTANWFADGKAGTMQVDADLVYGNNLVGLSLSNGTGAEQIVPLTKIGSFIRSSIIDNNVSQTSYVGVAYSAGAAYRTSLSFGLNDLENSSIKGF